MILGSMEQEARPTAGLYKRLTEYCRTDTYPLHMPGHKRQAKEAFMADFPNVYGIDITEIDGFDNLHHAEGILKESMEWAASVYGADRTYYLVNGSTCGVLSAVSAVCGTGKILMARNSHKSAYHAAALNGLKVRYIYPQIIDDFGIQGGLLAEEIEKMLISGGFSAVFVTSPTYDGVVSDIGAIAKICHHYGVPLVVDEAHGAHFSFGRRPGDLSGKRPGETYFHGTGAIPVSALDMGADIVIQSLHKTLPSLTQTALLHVRSRLVDPEKLQYYLQVFQSSSPSYVLMASIERCIEYMNGEGRERAEHFTERLGQTRERLKDLRCLRLLDRSVVGSAGVYDLDPWKIVLSVKDFGKRDGVWLAEKLRQEYRLEVEMCGADYVLAIVTLMDTEEGLERLERAAKKIDEELEQTQRGTSGGHLGVKEHTAGPVEAMVTHTVAVPEEATERDIAAESVKAMVTDTAAEPEEAIERGIAAESVKAMETAAAIMSEPAKTEETDAAAPNAAFTIREVMESPQCAVPLDSGAAGRISGEYVYLYPPGIPILVPGEVLTPDIIGRICEYRRRHLPIQGLRDHQAGKICVLSEV